MILELKSKYSNFILINTLKEISSDTQKSLLQTLDEQIEIGRQELEKVENIRFYKISEKGLSINRKDLNEIIEDPNMPRDVKREITKIFPHLS
jgi:hypothetical protein